MSRDLGTRAKNVSPDNQNQAKRENLKTKVHIFVKLKITKPFRNITLQAIIRVCMSENYLKVIYIV